MIKDSQIETDVLRALVAEPRIIPAHIGVAVCDGIVSLTGHVETFPEKQFPESAAKRVKGVKAVAEEIKVRISTVANRTDDEIARGAINHLSWSTLVPQNAIQVMVEKGVITLTGNVQSVHQKDAAAYIVHQLYGVVAVSNQIQVELNNEAIVAT